VAADRARLVNRIQKTLEDTNIKLASVVTDITGKSGRAILEAMLAGEQNPEVLAELAHRRMQGKREQLVQALQGTLSEHHRFLVASQLQQLDFFDRQIRELEHEIAHRMGLLSDAHDPDGPDTARYLPTAQEMQEPTDPPESAESHPPLSVQPAVPQRLRSASAIGILDEIPGVNERIGTIVVAELGTQMHQFPDEAHLSRLCRSMSCCQNQCQQTPEHQNGQGQSRASSGPH
jgi:transposase